MSNFVVAKTICFGNHIKHFLMQDFKVIFYIRKARAKETNKAPICLRLYLNKDRDHGTCTGFTVNPKDWDTKHNRVCSKAAGARSLNQKLELLNAEYMEIFRRYEFDERLSIDFIKEKYQQRLISSKNIPSVLTFMGQYLEEVKTKVGKKIVKATYTRYALCARLFHQYLKEKRRRSDINFSEIDHSVILGFEKYLRDDLGQDHNNTLMKKMRVLKTMLSEAQAQGWLETDPYKGYKIRYEPTDRGFLTDRELQTLMDLELTIPRLEKVRDFFIFSCFTGIAYTDMVNLTEDNIVELDGRLWIMTKRQKTNVPSNVLLLEIPLRIIEKYRGVCKDGHLFPLPTNQRVNSYLKELADLARIKKNLTFHIARHTFATMAISKNVPMESVSRMLGHRSLKTTMIYARITDKKVEQDMLSLAKKVSHFTSNI